MEIPVFEDFCYNASLNSTQDYFWSIRYSEYGMTTACFLLVIFAIGLPLNCLVAGTIIRQRLFKQAAHMLLLSLISSNSVMLLSIIPQSVITGFVGEYVFGNSDHMRCKLCHIGLLTTWFPLMSLYTVSTISLDRFLYIYAPLKYNQIVTLGRMIVVLSFIWVLSTVIAILPAFGIGEIEFTRLYATCSVTFFSSRKYYSGILLVATCIPLVILIICNMWVVILALKNIEAIYGVMKARSGTQGELTQINDLNKVMKLKRQKRHLHLIRVFGGLFLTSLVSWIPIIVMGLVAFALPYSDIPAAVFVLPYYWLLSHTVIHPALEAALISTIKDPIKNSFCSTLSRIKNKFSCKKFRELVQT